MQGKVETIRGCSVGYYCFFSVKITYVIRLDLVGKNVSVGKGL
jgi:hypothetical protein